MAREDAPDEFRFDLRGRIRNLGFPPSRMNALFPLFEAVSNGLHAIELRWGSEASRKGRLSVEILRQDSEDDPAPALGFVVKDNGVGLNSDNWQAFRTADTPAKLTRNGKGVGRLSWLKVLGEAKIASSFMDGEERYVRTFRFGIGDADTNPIKEHRVEKAGPDGDCGTSITLGPLAEAYRVYCPRRRDDIAAQLIGHFLKSFASYEVPHFELIDDAEKIDLLDFYSDNVVSDVTSEFHVRISECEVEVPLQIHHVLLRKSLKLHEGGKHWLFFVGDGRVVRSEKIDNQLGLGFVGPNGDAVYIGLVEGEFLNSHVNQERTSFTLSDESSKTIQSSSVAEAKEHLSSYIAEVRTKQAEAALRVIQENPQFLSVTNNVPEFVAEKLALSVRSEEEIFLELSREKLRQRRRTKGEIRKLAEGGGQDIEERVQRITRELNADKKGSLAEYVVKRKEILDLLGSSLAYADPEQRTYLKEEVVHDIVIPIRSDSDDLSYEDHNLWILDDRLAFYSYFKSDKPFNTFLAETDDRKEVDIGVVFDRSLAFSRTGRDEPIVIVEFKRPGRRDYDYNSSPVVQVLNYVDVFRSGGALVDKSGAHIKPIPISTRFICFVVADFNESLEKVIRVSPAHHKSADGEGYFGYSPEHNAFIEVMPYNKMLHDARLRNEAFFEKLGLKI